ncbi:MAG: LCP family protein [Ignavibacteriales bacterium]
MENKEPESKENSNSVPKKNRITKPLTVLAGVLVFLILAVMLTMHFYLSKINIVDQISAAVNEKAEYVLEKTRHIEGRPLSQTEVESMQKTIDKNAAKKVVANMYEDNVINVLLIGSDARKVGSSSRSDTMILLSVNKRTKEITVTSLMRDIYLAIPGHGYNRLNAAYAFGGSDLALDTIEKNFKIHVDKFVEVNFYTFIKVVDDLGGVTVDVLDNDNELRTINSSIEEINYYSDDDQNDGKLKHGGRLHLNGKQTLGYVRNRYYYDGDFTRTENQRAVVTQLSSIVFKLTPEQAHRLLSKYLPLVSTNLSETEMMSLLVYMPEFKNYKINQICIPTEDSFEYCRIRKMSVLQVDFEKNIKNTTKTIYGEPEKPKVETN